MQLQHKKTQQAMPCNYLKPPLFGKFSIVSSARVTWGPGEPVCDGAGWWVVLGSWELLEHLEPGEQLAGLWQHVTPYQLRAITTTAHHIKYILPPAPPQPPYSTTSTTIKHHHHHQYQLAHHQSYIHHHHSTPSHTIGLIKQDIAKVSQH